MSEDVARLHQPAKEVSAEALARAEEMIEREEGVQNRLSGGLKVLVATVAICSSLFHLYTAYAIVRPEHLRAIHVAFVLFRSRAATRTASCGGTGWWSPARSPRPPT